MKKLFFVLSAALLAQGACRDSDRPIMERDEFRKPIETVEPAPTPTPTPGADMPEGTADDDFVQTRTTYTTTARSRLDRINTKIDELEARTDAASQDAANRLRARRDELARRLDTIGTQTEAGWDAFESDMSRGLTELERELDAAIR